MEAVRYKKKRSKKTKKKPKFVYRFCEEPGIIYKINANGIPNS
jgi:hypothetical protein